MGNLPTIWTYGKYSGNNYGVNALAVSVGALDVYFSYRTPVAFRTPGRLVVRENDWGPTTGKHLNWIDDGDKDARVSGAEFERLLSEEIERREATVPQVA